MSTVSITRSVDLNIGAELRISSCSLSGLWQTELPLILNRGPYSLHESKLTIFIHSPNGMNEIVFHIIRATRNPQIGLKIDVSRVPSFKQIPCVTFKIRIVCAAEDDLL